MVEWWTYSLSDFLLFSPGTYYRLFELFNVAIWPAQILALAVGAVIVWLMRAGGAWAGRLVAALLAACWLWVAWAFLLLRYDTINWAARYFAIGFAVEALLLTWTGIVRNGLHFRRGADPFARAGIGLFVFALLVQPLLGPLLGRPWLQAEIFGIAPDPTVVASLAVLVAARRAHWELLVLPLLWCAISGVTLWTMQSPEAWMLPATAVLVLALVMWKGRARRAGVLEQA
jgi:Family of unknown function (DUF6064)